MTRYRVAATVKWHWLNSNCAADYFGWMVAAAKPVLSSCCWIFHSETKEILSCTEACVELRWIIYLLHPHSIRAMGVRSIHRLSRFNRRLWFIRVNGIPRVFSQGDCGSKDTSITSNVVISKHLNSHSGYRALVLRRLGLSNSIASYLIQYLWNKFESWIYYLLFF